MTAAALAGTASADTQYFEITAECLAAFRAESAKLKAGAAKVPSWKK